MDEQLVESASSETESLEQKKSLIDRLDNYFRRNDTVLAKAINRIDGKIGMKYLESVERDLLINKIAVGGLFLLSLPAQGAIYIAIKIGSKDDVFYLQERMSRIEGDGIETFQVWKFRSMIVGADELKNYSEIIHDTRKPEQDERATKIGKALRRFELDELPQLLQILLGQLNLIGIRATSKDLLEELERATCMVETEEEKSTENVQRSKTKIERWKSAYNATGPSLTGLNQVMNKYPKRDIGRFAYDTFYSKKAGLGLDMYILWRSIRRVIRF